MCQLKEACHKEEVFYSNIVMLELKATLFSNSGYFLQGFRCPQGTCLVLCFRGSAEWRWKL